MKNGMKKMLASVLASLILIGGSGTLMAQLPATVVRAEETEYSPEEDFQTTDNEDGTVTITKFTGYDFDINIPPTINGKAVTAIGDNAFILQRDIESVTIPDGVTSIGVDSFRNCYSLKTVVFPESLTEIGTGAFANCGKLESIAIPEGVTKIKLNTFADCNLLSNIYLPDSLTSIGDNAFSGSNLTSVTIPKNVQSISSSSFIGSKELEEITVAPENTIYDSRDNCNAIIQKSNNSLCLGCKTTVIPSTVKQISSYAFYGCPLTSIVIPIRVEMIGDYAFHRSGLTEITIPPRVRLIGSNAFTECSNLERIIVDPDNINYDSRDNCNALIETSSNALLAGCRNTVIPNTVTWICERAFAGQQSLTHILIPDSVTRIYKYAFSNCGILSAELSDNLEFMEYHVFDHCTNLTNITIPPQIAFIADNLFAGCSNLSSVTIPNGIRSIETRAFADCNNLIDIYYDGTKEEWGNIDIKSGNSRLTSGSVLIHYSVTQTPITESMVTLSAASYIYDGTEKKPTVTLKNGDETLEAGTDYTLSYNNNTNAGTGTVTVTGKGKYKGTVTKTFDIAAKALSSCTIESLGDYAYTGNEIQPALTVKDGTRILTNETDYSVSYSNNINVGTATATVTGKGNYTGSVEKEFTISQGSKAISSCTVTLAKTSYAFTGAAIKPAVTVKDGTKTLTKDTDYTVSYANNAKIGTATATITGKGSYTGTVKKTFTINPKALSGTTVTLSATSYVYSGTAKTPSVTVKDGTKVLTKGTDFTVVYTNNTKAGTATVTITGKGNYTGTLKKTFKIKAKAMSGATVTLSTTSYVYNGKAKAPVITVKDGSKTLVKGTDFTVAYSNNTGVGTATATITGKGNYTGAIKKTYKIVPAKPAAPGLTNTASGLKVTWKKAAGAGGYYVYRSKDGGNFTRVKTVTSGTSLAWNDTGAVSNGSKYCYKVMAYKIVNGKTYKSTFSTVKVYYRVNRPSLTLSNISQGIKLTVSKNAKATGYQMDISTLSNFSKKAERVFTKTIWKIKLPDKIGKKCYLRIRTYKTVGGVKYYSVWSAVKSIVVKQ